MGYFLVIFSSILFGTLPSIQNIAILNGASPFVVLLVCNGVCVAGSLLFCLLKKVDLRLNRKELLAYFLTGTLGLFLTDLFLNLAYTRIPVGMTTVIHFTYPTLVCIEATVFFKDRFTFSELLAIVLSIGGLYLLSDEDMALDLTGIIIAFASAMAYSFNLTMVDRSIIRDDEVLKKNFYVFSMAMIVTLIINFKGGSLPAIPFDQFSWLFIAGLMLMTGSMLMTKGIEMLGSSDAAFISTLEPIVSLIVSTVLYHYVFSPRMIIGCILVILSLLPIVFTKTS